MRGLILSLITVSGLLAQTIHISGDYLDLLDNPIDSASVYYYQDQEVVDSTLTSSTGAFDLQFTIVSTNPSLPSAFRLSQNYPNPFNPSTRIDLSIREPGKFSIYDIRGALVETLDLLSAGSYELTWGGRNLGAGLYIYVLSSGGQSVSRKMILLDGGDGSGLAANQTSYSTSGTISKPASNDAIRFEKFNTTPVDIDFFTPHADTSLGVIHGNVGPRQIQTIFDTIMYEGDTLQVDWNDYFYNDSETYFPPRFIEYMYLGDTIYYESEVVAIDVLDTTLIRESNTFSVTWLPQDHAPVASVTGYVGNGDEPVTIPQTRTLGTVNVTDADPEDVHTMEIIGQTDAERANVYLEGNQIKMEILDAYINGNINFGVRVADQTGLADTLELEHMINAQPDVTLKLRDLTRAGMPVYDDITSTIQIGDSLYQVEDGIITKQLVAGESYEINGFNDSTGFFDALGVKLADLMIAIRSPDMVYLEEENIEQRDFGDQSSAVTFTEEDKILDLYKFGMDMPDRQKMYIILDTHGADGLDKPNTLTPDVWADTTGANFAYADSQAYADAQYISEVMFPSLCSEFGFAPNWRGYGVAPTPDPEGTTHYLHSFDSTILPPGFGGNNLNGNTIYRAFVEAAPNNPLREMAVESIQAYLGMLGDPGTGGDITNDIVEYTDDQGIPHFNEFFYTVMRTWFVFDKGTNLN